jgi:ketosteroid isomerase-like protein
MYHSIVKRIATTNFQRVNNGDYDSLLAGCAQDVHHRFGGTHALSGERHDKDTLRAWFQRLGRLDPNLTLTVTDVWVTGGPWNTRIIIRWTATSAFPDGSPYANHGVHIVHMRWGKILEIDANEDSQAVAEVLHARAAAGLDEAVAAPIES